MNQTLYLQYASLPVPKFDQDVVDEETYFQFIHLEADIAGRYSQGELSEELTKYFTEKLIYIEEKIPSKLDSEFRASVQLLLDAISSE